MNYIKEYPIKNGNCQVGGCNKIGVYRRQNTQYNEDELNWACFCEEHQKESDEYWKEMWRDLYNNVL